MTALCVRFYQQAAFQRQKEACSCRSGAFSSSILELRVKYLRAEAPRKDHAWMLFRLRFLLVQVWGWPDVR